MSSWNPVKAIKKAFKSVKKAVKGALRSAKDTFDSAREAVGLKMPTIEETVIPMPDEEEIRRAKRRKASMRGGGRASTILSQDFDNDPLGGY